MLYSRNRSREPWGHYDQTYKVLVIAKNEEKARELATRVAGDEGKNAWANPKLSACKEIDPDSTPRILCWEYNAG